MTAPCFVDTNIFVYAGSKDPADAEKKRIARSLLAEGPFGLSTQVLQEFIASSATKKRLGITEDEAKATIISLIQFPIAPITPELVLSALEIKREFRISYWDAAIIAAAEAIECEIIYSEDLSSGQKYRGIIVQNPFIAQARAKS